MIRDGIDEETRRTKEKMRQAIMSDPERPVQYQPSDKLIDVLENATRIGPNVPLRAGDDTATADRKYKTRTYIMESQREGQDFAGFLPATDDLPETHEHYIRHYREMRNGRELMMVEISVRPKLIQPEKAADGLNDQDEDNLAVAGAGVGLSGESFDSLPKPQKITAIRQKRAEKA